MPSNYKALRDIVIDCNRHFETVIRDAKAVFTSENAQRAIDDWIYLVIDASKEIQSFYRRSSLGTCSIPPLRGQTTDLIQRSSPKRFSRLRNTA